MKALIYASLLFIKVSLLPNTSLLIWAIITIVVDFLTGYAKAVALNKPRTSGATRRTFPKYIQYVGAILLTVILTHVAPKEQQHFLLIATDGVIMLMVYAESLSILENLIEMKPSAMMARVLFVPLHKLLTLQLKNNPLAKAGETITEAKS